MADDTTVYGVMNRNRQHRSTVYIGKMSTMTVSKDFPFFFFFFGRMCVCVSLSINRFNNWHDVNRIRERRLQFLLIIICSRNLIWVVDFGWWPIMTWLFYLKLTRLSTCESAPKKINNNNKKEIRQRSNFPFIFWKKTLDSFSIWQKKRRRGGAARNVSVGFLTCRPSNQNCPPQWHATAIAQIQRKKPTKNEFSFLEEVVLVVYGEPTKWYSSQKVNASHTQRLSVAVCPLSRFHVEMAIAGRHSNCFDLTFTNHTAAAATERNGQPSKIKKKKGQRSSSSGCHSNITKISSYVERERNIN